MFLSVDFGTSAVKAAIVNEEGKILCHSKADYSYLILPGEKNELRVEDLMGAFYQAAAGLPSELKKKVETVCYDTFSPSLIFLDRSGNLLYPNIITHLDRRSRAQTEYISKTFGNTAYMNISGIYPFPGGCSAMTLLWFRENMPEVLEKSYAVGHLTTLIHYLLTGNIMVDFVNASMLGVYETTTQGGWSKELLNAFELPEAIFPEILAPGTLGGSLKKDIAFKLGVREGISVCVGTNDVAAAQMGAGNQSSGCMMNTTGSSEIISVLTDQPRTDPGYYLRNAALPGLWQIFAITCGGFGVDWFWRQFCQEMTREEFYKFEEEQINRYLEVGSEGVWFEPYLSGDRQSLEKKTGAFHGLTLGTTKGQMLVAYLAAIQDVIYGTVEKAAKQIPLKSVVKVSGGMATESYLNLKKKLYPNYQLQMTEECPILGNVELAKYYLR
ncbi:FGGY-family carbohydrate kinase [Hominifimenecus sp. rT4P-3]|uniref:FGGY-family carbohydrate kinase n=1 Tax=Hominifimenecus sp. rT4P-3 TaxID=3242979 RepID=UPI003DA46596